MDQIPESTSALRLGGLLTRDFTPWANRYVYWLKTPLGVLIAAAVIALMMGCFVTPQGFVIFGAIAGVLAIGICWPWIGLRGIGCTIHFPRVRCEEAEEVAVEVEISNRWPFPVWGLAVERGFFRRDEEKCAAVVSLARIPGWSTCRFAFAFQPEVRGVYPIVPPAIATEFPFGLWKAHRSSQVVESLLVWPRILSLAPLELPAGNCRQLVGINDARSGDHGDRTGARPYRQGDSLRNVHWAATARCDRLIVSERQESAQSSVTIVIDCKAANHSGTGANSTFEWGLRIGLSVAAAIARQKINVRVEMGNQTYSLDGMPASWRRLLDAAARLEPVATAPLGEQPRSGLVFVVRTDLADPLACESRGIVLRTAKSSASSLQRNHWIEIDVGDSIGLDFAQVWNRRRR